MSGLLAKMMARLSPLGLASQSRRRMLLVRLADGRIARVPCEEDAAATSAVRCEPVPPLRLRWPSEGDPRDRLSRLPDDALGWVAACLGVKDMACLAVSSKRLYGAMERSHEWRRRTGLPMREYCMNRAGQDAWWHAKGVMGGDAAKATLAPGAPLARIELAEQAMGLRLPHELKMALMAHDGQRVCPATAAMRRGGTGVGAVRLLSVAEMVEAREREPGLRGTVWIPIAERAGHQIAAVHAGTGAVHVLEGRLALQAFPPVAAGFFYFLRYRFT